MAGAGKSGGKQTVYQRLCSFVTRYELRQRADSQPSAPIPQETPPVQEPLEEERRLHDLRHLPYRNWYKFCVSHKVRNDAHHATDQTKRSIRIISFDFSYTGRDEEVKGQEDASKNKLICLVLHDLQSGWRGAIPIKQRGGCVVRAYLASEVPRLLARVGHNEVHLRHDPEPVCVAVHDAIAQSRARLGCKTLFDQVPERTKSSPMEVLSHECTTVGGRCHPVSL